MKIKMFFSQTKVILILIIIIAAFLRFYHLNELPLYGDELTMVYDSYSILKTGHDQTGAFLPLTFSMGAGRPAGYVYSSIPFVALFGPSALGVRMLSVLSGLGLILIIFYLGKQLFNERVGLISAGLLAISPWDINLSRGGFEAHFALFLALIGIFAFLKSKQKPWWLIITALTFALTIHTYPTYKLTLPLLLVLLIWFTKNSIKFWQKKFMAPTIIAVLILILASSVAFYQTLNAGSESRFFTINAFSKDQLKQDLLQKINSERHASTLPIFMQKFFYNRPLEYTFFIGESYIKNFSLDFLFLHGDRNPRHNMSTMGGFYLIEFVLILLGLIYLSRNYQKELIFLIIWLLIAPLPASLLIEQHGLRTSFMLIPLILLSAGGLFSVFDFIRNKKTNLPLVIIFLLFAIQFVFFVEKLYFLAPVTLNNFWSYPAKLAADIINEEKNNFSYVVLSDRIDNIEYAYNVYNKIDPSLVVAQNLQKQNIKNYQFKVFDNVLIGNVADNQAHFLSGALGGSVLYLGSPLEKQNFKDFNTFYDSNGLPILIVKRFKI